METIRITSTKNSPEVVLDFDNGIAEVVGESYPENAVSFYKPVFDWLNQTISQKKPFKFVFKLDYFNTSSSKCIIDILDLLQIYHSNGGKINVEWYYRQDDEDMKDTGEEFLEDVDLPHELIAYK
ncbi:hypothetical protein LPTSP4_24390 [Leptospira ryugenii]|uniref:SiaC family regulatory phosphoprotein domain-containing protein n=1 Tax=Leptospira ryugenii TaxID=1917863 RepID=A0A2P2E1Y5_9LEPT|nr:DUF1987 domain-containing protein [Leptospira ryugenii]GBF50912.1 hypothetical protein LPTSP4_24390 [Leptospira ryugenii]